MFLKSERHDPPSKKQTGELHGMGSHSTFISADTIVGGDLSGAGEVQIDGEVGGDVHGRRVSVGAEGVVMGNINAEFVAVAGTVRGRIEAFSVSLAKSAEVDGTITHNEIDIEPGAKIDGRRPWRPPSYFEQNRKW